MESKSVGRWKLRKEIILSIALPTFHNNNFVKREDELKLMWNSHKSAQVVMFEEYWAIEIEYGDEILKLVS